MRHNGHFEFTHQVVKGQSLTSILHHYQAMGYPLKRWEPIYLLTQRRTHLWVDKGPPQQHDNPDLIYPGDLLVFPRSHAGYDLAIHRIQALARDVRHQPSEVKQIKKEGEEFGDKIDLISDVLQLVVSCGGTAITSLREAKGAVGVAAKLKLANAHGMGKEIGQKLEEFVEKMAIKKTYGEKGETANKVVESGKKAKEMYEAAKLAKTARHAVELVGRGAEIILDWVSPSTIAKAITHFDREMDKASEKERSTREALLHTLHEKTIHLTHERNLLYSK